MAEIIQCDSWKQVVETSDWYAPELKVLAEDLDWWKINLKYYGSLFRGERSTASNGD